MLIDNHRKRIAIVTASPPGERGVGQNYMRDLVDTIVDQEVHLFALLRDEAEWRTEDRGGLATYQILNRRYEHRGGIGAAILGRASSALAFRLCTLRYAKLLAARLTAELSARDVDAVLVVMESPLLMLIAKRLVAQARYPVSLLLWDHPDRVATMFGHEGSSAKRLGSAFVRSCAGAASALTVSDALAGLISQENSSLPVSIYRSPAPSAGWERAEVDGAKGAPFSIGFAGSVTAPEELELLQKSLDRLSWQVGDRRIVLRLFGNRFTLVSSHPRHVEYRGHLQTRDDVVQALSGCDICFLPQPFSEDQRRLAEYSFPTKISSYLAAGRPLLVLAPPYSSVAEFCQNGLSHESGEATLGFLCSRADTQALAGIIKRLVEDQSFLDAGVVRARKTAEADFQSDAGEQSVRDWLANF